MLEALRIRFGVAILAMLAGALFLVPGRAAADSFTVDASITWCELVVFDSCLVGAASGPITGSYEFTDNGTTDSIGAWSFDLSSLGLSNISGTSGKALEITPFENEKVLQFNDDGANNGTLLGLIVLDPSDLVPAELLGGVSWDDFNRPTLPVEFIEFSSVTLTAQVPEPSSLPLLGLGLAPLAWFRFRRGLGRLAGACRA